MLFPIFLPQLGVQVLTGQTRPSVCHPSIPRHLIEDEDDNEHENENKAPLQRDVSFDSGPGVETPGPSPSALGTKTEDSTPYCSVNTR